MRSGERVATRRLPATRSGGARRGEEDRGDQDAASGNVAFPPGSPPGTLRSAMRMPSVSVSLVLGDPTGPFTPLGDGFAERAFDLAGSGVSIARYVRIESLRIEADVFRWPGSPTNPGPEIDAVGVVHLP